MEDIIAGAHAALTQPGSGQILTFLLAGEEYGVEILRVQEIRGWDGATQIPNLPIYVKGVINLRGIIVPIVDLRRRFNLDRYHRARPGRPLGAEAQTVRAIFSMLQARYG